MNKFQTFQEFLATQSIQIPVLSFFFNLVLAAILALILGNIYTRFGYSLSNRRVFSRNLMLLSMITMLIISIVKSSLALSLGLVGALSIVRFRTAIKEPEELLYLFFAIAIGLGLGANQTIITLLSFIVIITFTAILKWKKHPRGEVQNLYLTIRNNESPKMELENILNILYTHCTVVDLKRFDETNNVIEVSFLIEFNNIDDLNKAKQELFDINKNLTISFLDNKGMF